MQRVLVTELDPHFQADVVRAIRRVGYDVECVQPASK